MTAGALGILFGLVGGFAGVSGAVTFVPYHAQNHQDLATGQMLAVVSAIGAVVSALGVAVAYSLLRARDWAWTGMLSIAIGCIATVAAFAVLTPPSTPSPVPGGPGAGVFLAVVLVAYGAVILLLFAAGRPRASIHAGLSPA
ncbi:MAG TPA: hypothetical protein VEY07_05530 [Thermoplasmata archaeon]|nr:hypothetical protein [Thermoplasmata archaeon]